MRIASFLGLALLAGCIVGCGSDTTVTKPEGPVAPAPSNLSEKADDNQSMPTAPAVIE